MRVLFLTRYNTSGASSRYRSFQYLPYLRERGYTITVAPLLSDLYIERLYAGNRMPVLDVAYSFIRRIMTLRSIRKFDLIWLEGEAFPWLPYWLESLLFTSAIPYVVDYDDALFHRYDQHPKQWVRRVLGSKIDQVMANAALVIAGNKYIADRAYKAGARWVEIIPTPIDTKQFPFLPMPHNEVFTIGWIGSLSTARYLIEIEDVLQHVCRDIPARLVTVGIRKLDLKDVQYEVVQPWSEETEVAQMKHFDVGIMPLVDSWWERGKCGHKLIKYMACGRPVVASPIGVNREIVEHGVNGFLASTKAEWLEALNLLYANPTLRENMGKTGRQKVEAEYSYDVTAPHLAALFDEVLRETQK